MSDEIFDKKARKGSDVRSMPSSLDAEKGLLSSCLQDAGMIDEFANLPDEAFHFPAHRSLWQCLRAMRGANKPVDLVTVTEQLTEVGELENLGGPGWITEIWSFVPTSANADFYASLILDRMLRRRIIADATGLVKLAYEDFELSAEQLVESVESKFMALRNAGERDAIKHIKGAVQRAMQRLEATYASRGKPTGLATGLNDFDRMTSGLHAGQLVVIAARPGMGKTCFLMQMAREFAEQGPVQVFSLEMSEDELAERLIATESRLNLGRMRDGFLQKSDFAALPGIYGTLVKKPIYVDDTGGLSILDFRSRARRAVVRYGARAIFVDYLQLLKSTAKRAMENRALEVAEISMTLKACAKELKVPVIAAAQLNRDADGRNSAPRLSDLRESGQIEQDADIVAMLHRPKKDSDEAEDKQLTEVHIVKQRNGPVGKFSLRFIGENARFENVTEKLFSNNEGKRQK